MRKPSSGRMSQPMQVLVSRETTEWYTPPWLIERVRVTLGSIRLDPASHPIPQAWIQAEQYFTHDDDGLSRPWFGNVFLNPPYNGSSAQWTAKLISEYQSGRVEQGVLLVSSKLGYAWYEKLWSAYPVCCLRERVRFVSPDGQTNGQAKCGSTLVYLGQNVDRFGKTFKDMGRVILPETR
jgi:DNA N-6-adenine-methyltransferase (Dam)